MKTKKFDEISAKIHEIEKDYNKSLRYCIGNNEKLALIDALSWVIGFKDDLDSKEYS